MDRNRRFWDRIADRYAASPLPDPDVYDQKLEMTRARLAPEMELVELGCGTGGTAIAHAPRVRHIRAIDVSDKMLAHARRKAEAAEVDNVSFERAAIGELEVPDGSVDMVLALSILHLVPDRDAVIAQAWRMLKPGGWLVSSTTCMSDGYSALRWIAPLAAALGRIPSVRFFSGDELVQSMERAGFEIEERWLPGRRKALFLVARKPG